MFWILYLILFLVVVVGLWSIRFLYRFYIYSIQPRYINKYGTEMFNMEVDYFSSHLKHYYADTTKSILRRDWSYDEKGVYIFNDEPIYHYNCAAVTQFGMLQYEKYLADKSQDALNSFAAQLKWIEENAHYLSEEKAIWYYLYDTPEEKAPWGSGISQGMAISTLLRGYSHFGEKKFLDLAIKAFNTLNEECSKGGFRFSDDKFKLFYEEDNHEGHILNGHIFALWGIFDLYRVTSDSKYKEFFDKGCQTILDNINLFDMGFSTKYDAYSEHPANNSYHYIHAIQFKVLGILTGNTAFTALGDKFLRYHEKAIYKVKMFVYLLLITIKGKISKA